MAISNTGKDHAKTKIVATLGPVSKDPRMIAALIEEGVDVFRINMAHGDRAEHIEHLANVRRLSAEAGRPIGVLIDLAGPKIRLGSLLNDPTECQINEHFTFIRGDKPNSADQLVCNYESLIDELSVGDCILLADGAVGMEVVKKEPDAAHCRVVEPGVFRSRQGVNLPGVVLSVSALTDSDLDNAAWAAKSDIDFVSLSFVRSEKEIQQLKELLRARDCNAMVIAKIEKPEALEHLDAIVQAADGVMVARGDLGVEIDVAETPIAQKRIIATCQRYRKPVIVATQMLDSMQHSKRPTRAEATDVANAILDGADACMLSGETAIGEYPRETVAMMNRIMLKTEELLRGKPSESSESPRFEVHPITSAAVYSAARMAQRLAAKLVVIVTRSGATARIKAKQRDFIPTIGVSHSESALRKMCLFWGIVPLSGAPCHSGPEVRKFIDRWGREEGSLEPGDFVVFVTGTDVTPGAHNLIVVHEVEA